ncbi:hypothetical protein N7539_006415 [Penicillium diatomitis]|uniref:HORMA domain-containing protein n=1 Tax=Penicillium diatomitis TaxID=2819901 RepID=A0A9W9X332_9EURO|nr:uncharacterized protein N7539_006415 [Penicillium diatomitis]KAJ5482969.1 hypothetical protein N7539_006415 [Penicillium diatomitis]
MTSRLMLNLPRPPSAKSHEPHVSKLVKLKIKNPSAKQILSLHSRQGPSVTSKRARLMNAEDEPASKRQRLNQYQERALHYFQEYAPLSTRFWKVIPTDVFNYPELRNSIELMKIVIHSMVASISYLRLELLPLASFGARDLRTYSYEDGICYEEHFIHGAHGRVDLDKANIFELQAGRVMVMERFKDERTDDLLDLLDDEILVILTKRQLAGIQLWLCESSSHSLTILEKYCISIGSRSKASASRQDSTQNDSEKPVEFDEPKRTIDKLTQFRREIFGLLRKLTVLADRLSSPPDSRKLVLHYFVDGPVSKQHLQCGLSDWPDNPIGNLDSTAWRRETLDCGFVDTGFYT